MNLNLIVAVDEAGGFGKDGKIPWNIPEDMQYFKDTTRGSVCVMGRRTYEDMLAMRTSGNNVLADDFELLPGRESYVVSSNENLLPVGATRVSELGKVFSKHQKSDRKIFILGGRRLFIQALSYRPTVHMTIVKGDPYNCDVTFPVDVLSTYKIANGYETEQCYYVEYRPT